MSEVPDEADAGSTASGDNSVLAARDQPVDVCISYLEAGSRNKQLFRSSRALVEKLIEWKRGGQSDILLTWGSTSQDVRANVERQLTQAGVVYRLPTSARQGTGPFGRVKLLLIVLFAVALLALVGVRIARFLRDAGEGVNLVAEEQREREEQNQRMVARTFEAMKVRTFRELENPDPATRLESVALVGQMYTADEQATPAMIKRLKDSDKRVRLAAIQVLAKIRPRSAEATQALRGCLADEDEQIRQAAQEALGKLQ